MKIFVLEFWCREHFKSVVKFETSFLIWLWEEEEEEKDYHKDCNILSEKRPFPCQEVDFLSKYLFLDSIQQNSSSRHKTDHHLSFVASRHLSSSSFDTNPVTEKTTTSKYYTKNTSSTQKKREAFVADNKRRQSSCIRSFISECLSH